MHRTQSLAAAVSLALAPLAIAAQSSAAPAAAASAHEFLVTPAWLAARINDPSLVIIHIGHDDYDAGPVPGAREVAYGQLVANRNGLGSELPDANVLRERLEALGVSDNSTVVVYAHEAPMATRALFSLAYIGIERSAYLDGGFERWRAEGHPVSRERPAVTPGRITRSVDTSILATHDILTARTGQAGTTFVDTRTDGEYNGSGNRSGMPSAGHLAGAKQLEWQDLFADGMARLKPRAELERLFRERVAPGDTVITYCWVGYRASATWFVARALGYRAMMYDGSYQDWQQRGLPTKAGTAP
jgi:thiosulfate/3-mercaptopyruvate sulfurtransferase